MKAQSAGESWGKEAEEETITISEEKSAKKWNHKLENYSQLPMLVESPSGPWKLSTLSKTININVERKKN